MPRISWAEIGPTLELAPEVFDGRIVIIGQEYLGSGDVFRGLPHPADGRGRLSGLELQGLMTSSLMAPAPLHDPGPAKKALFSIVATLACAGVVFVAIRPGRAFLAVGLAAAAYLVACQVLLRVSAWIMPMAAVLVPLLLIASISAVSRRRLRPYPC
jgi:CHASE2 domain-containing sensor protein